MSKTSVYTLVNGNMQSLMEIWGPKDIGVTTLTFWGHLTSSITWPSDSAWELSYWWSLVTMHLSCTDTEIPGIKNFGVTSLTFWGHVTVSVTWPLDSAYAMWLTVGGPLEPCVCLAPFWRYKASNLHLPMLKAKSSLCMLRVTWPVGRALKWPHIWNSRGHIAYSLYNFYGPTMTIGGRL